MYVYISMCSSKQYAADAAAAAVVFSINNRK